MLRALTCNCWSTKLKLFSLNTFSSRLWAFKTRDLQGSNVHLFWFNHPKWLLKFYLPLNHFTIVYVLPVCVFIILNKSCYRDLLDLTMYRFNNSSYHLYLVDFHTVQYEWLSSEVGVSGLSASNTKKHNMCVHMCMLCVLCLYLTLFHPDQCFCPTDPKLEKPWPVAMVISIWNRRD